MMLMNGGKLNPDITLEEFIEMTEGLKKMCSQYSNRASGQGFANSMFEYNLTKYEIELKFARELAELRKENKSLKILLKSYKIAEENGMIKKNDDTGNMPGVRK